MAEPAAVATFTLRFAELARAVAVSYLRPLVLLTVALAGLTVALGGSVVAGLAFLVAFPILTLGSTAVLSWVLGGRLRRPVTLTFDSDGVSTSPDPDAPAAGTLDWGAFRRLQRSGDVYLLRLARGPGQVIVPGRGFAGPEDETTFLRLVGEQVGQPT